MAASFHPELADDDRVHQLFVTLVDEVRTGNFAAKTRG
jgi:glutamine amidotransferase PdxT